MDRSWVADLAGREGDQVKLCGWVHAVDRSDDGVAATLRDRSGSALLRPPSSPCRHALGSRLASLAPGSAVEALGTVADAAPGTQPQLVLDELHVLGPAMAEVPLRPGASLEQRLDWRFLDLRSPENQLVFRVQTTLERAMRARWASEGFVEIHSPKLKPTPNQSGSELFSLEYFGGRAYLAQSPQFYKQMAMAAGFERVFEIGPVFRANPLPTPWHDTEFTSVDVELSWIGSHEEVMAWEERWLREVVVEVAEDHGVELRRWFGMEVTVPEVPFPRVDIATARGIVEASGYSLAHCPGDLDREGERRLAAHVAAEHGHDLVFVTGYPEEVRPFYHMRCQPGSVATRSFDLLWKGLEVTTGAQREHRYEVLMDQARARGLSLDPLRYYLDFFRFGCPPHGGFGLGLTRVLMVLLGRSTVRDVTFLPRTAQRLHP